MNTSRDAPEIDLVLYRLGAIASLEDMAAQSMAPRPSIHVRREESLYSSGEVGLGRPRDDVQMVGHDHEGEHPPRAANGGPTQLLDETIAVGVISNDILTAVTTGHQMINRAGTLNSQSSRHALN